MPAPELVEAYPGARVPGRLRVLISAYACEPEKGSEPGVGWHVACEMSKRHEVWVITRSSNRDAIEVGLRPLGARPFQVIYYDLPYWMRWWKRGSRGVQLHYYLWQIGAYLKARKLHRNIGFDLAHHATFVRYWMPSFLALLPIPFVWGPVGGGESVPWHLLKGVGFVNGCREMFREVARWLGEHDPFVKLTARRSAVTLATTPDTARRIGKLGGRRICVQGESALSSEDFSGLSRFETISGVPLRVASIGRLIYWKGFHLGLQAFAVAGLRRAEYRIIGDGPERRRLKRLADELGLSDRVSFLGNLSRRDVLQQLRSCHVLVHPSLHDSGGWVCLEAMAAGKPVVCLDLGGPGMQVSEDAGIKVAPDLPDRVVKELAVAIRRLAEDQESRSRLGAAGRARVQQCFLWEGKGRFLTALYEQAVSEHRRAAVRMIPPGPIRNSTEGRTT